MESEERTRLRDSQICVLQVIGLLASVVLFWWAIKWQLQIDSEYFSVEVTGISASNFTNPQLATTTSSPSFDLAMLVDNQHGDTLCLSDWQFSFWHAGTPLGRGSIPGSFCLKKMTRETVTGATSSELVGLAQDVHDHMANGESMAELEVQIDMRLVADLFMNDDDVPYKTTYRWLWCPSKLGGHSACQIHRVTKAGLWF